jgi:hypothetical protein
MRGGGEREEEEGEVPTGALLRRLMATGKVEMGEEKRAERFGRKKIFEKGEIGLTNSQPN